MKKILLAGLMALAPSSVVLAQPSSALISANQYFAFDWFGQVAKTDAGKNVFVSPYSATSAIGMLNVGAAGETQTGIAKVLGMSGSSSAKITSELKKLRIALTNTGGSEFIDYNSVWLSKAFKAKASFVLTNRAAFKTQVSYLDFSSPEAPEKINSWVSLKTKGKITSIVDKLQPANKAVLVNAIYFKGAWQKQFDPAETQQKPFFLSPNKSKEVAMMSQHGRYRYFENELLQVVQLPYKGNQAMYVFLPKGENQDFLKDFTAKNWIAWKSSFAFKEGSIQLPRFRLEYKKDLTPELSRMGMASAFSPSSANFSKLSTTQTFISAMLQKTFVEVNETGTEAAAVTGATMSVTSIAAEPPFNFNANKPFQFLIRDEGTGAILFMGSIANPE